MSKKKHAHEEHVNHERWLVSYADFITLLFAFFVVLFSSSQVDRSKTNKMSLAIEAAFSRFSLFKEQAGELNLMGTNGKVASSRKSVITSEEGAPLFMAPELMDESSDEQSVRYNMGPGELSENVGVPSTVEKAMQRAQQDLTKLLDKHQLAASVGIGWDERGLVVSVRDVALFKSGVDELTPESKIVLDNVAQMISRLPNQVRIEGHTDDRSPGAPFDSNWQLSSARATHIVEWLVQEFDIDPSRLVAVGYGQYRPVADNKSEPGRQRNRRVDIVILSEQAAKKEAPLPMNLPPATASQPTRDPFDNRPVRGPVPAVRPSTRALPETPATATMTF